MIRQVKEETSNSNIDTVLARLTAARAANLDNLNRSLDAIADAMLKCRGNIYYVDVDTGDDDNSGTEPDEPKATFTGTDGITSVWGAHDLIIASGAFGDEHVEIDVEGIRILGFASGGPGTSGGAQTSGLTFEIKERNVEIGFIYGELSGSVTRPFIKTELASSFYYYIHDLVIDSWTSNDENILHFDSGEGKVENVQILACDAGTGHAIYTKIGADNIHFKNVIISGCTAANGFYIEGTAGGSTTNMTLSNTCIVHNTVTGAGLTVSGTGAYRTIVHEDCVIEGNTTDISDSGTNSIILCALRTRLGMAPYVIGLDYREADLTTTAGNKTLASRTVADSELFRSKNGSDSEISQILLVAEIGYIDDSGSANGLDLTTSTHNQMQINIGGTGLDDCPFSIAGSNSGQFVSGDFEVPANGGGGVTLIADISDLTTSTLKDDVSQSILLQLTNGRALGNNLRLKVSTILRIFYNGRAGL